MNSIFQIFFFRSCEPNYFEQVPDATLVHDHRLPSFEQQSSAPVATAAEDALSGSAIADGDRELAVVSLLANQLKPSSSICTDALVSKTSEKFELGLSASGGLVLLSSSAGCREDVVVAGNDEDDGDDHGVGVGADLPDDFAFQLKEVGGPSSSSSASPTMGASSAATEVQQEIVAPIPASTTVAVTNEVDTSRKGRKKKSSKKRGRQAEAPTSSAPKEEIQQQPQHPPPADATSAAKTPNKKDPQRRHRCPEEGCSFSASYAKDMARHALTHSGEKPFACPHCPKRFSRKDKVAVHVRTHTGDRPFKCRLCDYAASESGSLAKHMRVHTGERPFRYKRDVAYLYFFAIKKTFHLQLPNLHVPRPRRFPADRSPSYPHWRLPLHLHFRRVLLLLQDEV